MLIYPAIDIKGGKCVRLTQGEKDQEKVYFENPSEVARLWQEKGAKILHVVDLDGAFEGESKNLPAIQSILQAVTVPLQLGGGIRSLSYIEQLFGLGVDRVVIGTKALEDAAMLHRALEQYGDRIVVSIDAKNGYVTLNGWTKTSTLLALDFAQQLVATGVKTIVYTDIAKDGMLQGPNFEEILKLREAVGVKVIASGGITTLEDVKKLRSMKIDGAIIGKALYERKIDLDTIGEGTI